MQTKQVRYWTIDEIENTATRAGSHFFDPATMNCPGFRSRILDTVYQGPGGVYFVSSEAHPRDGRRYTVRQFIPPRRLNDPFHSTSSKSAKRCAWKLAAKPLQDQFDAAWLALDGAISGPGGCVPFGQLASVQAGGVVILSNGSECRAERYQDDSGFYLVVKHRRGQSPIIADTYPLQREVCRVLETFHIQGNELPETVWPQTL